MIQKLNELAQTAISALEAINKIDKGWRDALSSRRGHGQYVNPRPQIAEHLHIELLKAIVDFDCEPVETLEELKFQMQDEADDYDGGRFDYLTSRGVK